MKALICREYGPPENLRVQDMPDLRPGPGEVVVRVRAAGVNFPDALIVQNLYQFKPTPPFSPGGETAGEVLAVGEGEERVKVGDKVIALTIWGGFAEQVLAKQDQVIAMPEGLSYEVAGSLLLTYGTCIHALRDRAALQPGQTVLVLGAAGGIGIAAIELAKALGARVIAAASSAEKLATCRAQGADEVINYREQNLRDEVKRLTGGQGVDVVVDPVGGDYAEQALRSIAWRGRYLVVGFTDGQIPRLPLNLVLLKGCAIVGVFWGDFIRREPQAARNDLCDLVELLGQGKIKPLISGRYSLERAAEAIVELSQRRAQGKLIVLP
ncbi:MAG: NADPH:quinone oxidoreductase family protein [Betaproteobacteria bacterium]|nr:NADPH:quinone oxidoreductase family protein [Betaproteobacteria bacterium]